MCKSLERELEVYAAERASLLDETPGKYVLIYRDEVIGVFPTDFEAAKEGYARLGNVPFLVKEIVELETAEDFVSNLLAV